MHSSFEGEAILRSALGVAGVNAFSAELLSSPQNAYELIENEDAFASVDIKNGKRVALVGAFTPYIRKR